MKRSFITALLSILLGFYCIAQDTITLKNSDDIKAKVLEVTTTEIKYKKFENLNGPTYSILKSDILLIRYENGTKDIFNEEKNNNGNYLPLNKSFSERTFYVEKTSEGYEQAIIDKLLKLNIIVTTNKETSDYTIKCIISKNGGWGVPAEGSIVILESKTENSLLVSKSAKGMVNMFRGFQNPRFIIMKKIADNYLEDLIEQLKSQTNLQK
ncbi:hypothetical protein [Parafilimonas sp.]|uniref:hypothetical protein n=1 Tax=Parafilimonas sp. TaxID=1969739 RepID=UPI003F800A53